jgi:hypothetical protein
MRETERSNNGRKHRRLLLNDLMVILVRKQSDVNGLIRRVTTVCNIFTCCTCHFSRVRFKSNVYKLYPTRGRAYQFQIEYRHLKIKNEIMKLLDVWPSLELQIDSSSTAHLRVSVVRIRESPLVE